MELIVICLVAFFTATLTFFSGFGLGTILMPVFAIFFPVDIAIALTGVVHFSNNLFKISLVGKKSDREVLLKFGIPAILASFAGAWLLLRITKMPSLFEYQLWNKNFEITPVKLIIAILLSIFSLLEILPSVQKVQFSRNKLALGGVLSGFFGGLTGIQGAIRSAFLIKSGLTKEAYIATGVVIACLVDFTRLSVYASRFKDANLHEHLILIISATLAAIIGAFTGNKLLKKVTLRFVQALVAIMLFLISIALGAGII
ncbi:MAG TPA: sulfite exporter TauE/SafE family protein [Bacteroidaceae bacterium]|nr:sulfite exporter TauE/SafE family protein [Bacteroidaceae bacterium]